MLNQLPTIIQNFLNEKINFLTFKTWISNEIARDEYDENNKLFYRILYFFDDDTLSEIEIKHYAKFISLLLASPFFDDKQKIMFVDILPEIQTGISLVQRYLNHKVSNKILEDWFKNNEKISMLKKQNLSFEEIQTLFTHFQNYTFEDIKKYI